MSAPVGDEEKRREETSCNELMAIDTPTENLKFVRSFVVETMC